MHQSRTAPRITAAIFTATFALSGVAATAQPAGLNLPKLSHELLSSSGGEESPVPVTTPAPTTTTTTPVPDANLQDVVPDMDFRRYLNRNYFDREDAPNTPISAAEMATVTAIGTEGIGYRDAVIITPYSEDRDCPNGCDSYVFPDLEGLQYATNLEVLSIQHVSKLPEFDVMPHLRFIRLNFSYIDDYSMLQGDKFPALRALKVQSDVEGAYPGNLGGFKQLESLELHLVDDMDLPEEITELTQLRRLTYNPYNQHALPESIGNMRSLEFAQFDNAGETWAGETGFSTLPDSMANLDNLRVLNLQGSPNLSPLPAVLLELESLEGLFVISSSKGIDDPVRDELQRRGILSNPW